MTFLAYFFAVCGDFGIAFNITAVAGLIVAAVFAGTATELSKDDERRVPRARLAKRFAIAAVVSGFLGNALPARDDIKSGVDLAHDLTCQPGGCK